jgi:3-oxoacyl-[acyl-carrier protein] reductase
MMLKDKRIFVSGGTGYIGSAICRACANYGARVVFSYFKNEDSALNLQSEMENSKAVRIDLKNVPEMEEIIESLQKDTGGFDVLINNAGVSQVMPFALIEENDFDFIMEINVKGTFFLTKAIVRNMIRRKKGSIVNIGSIAGQRLLDVPVHYSLSKAAISGFTLSLASELKPFGIRVNSVVPGLIEDGISRNIPKELREDFNRHCATGRPGTGNEVAELVCFLASDRSSYINGQNIFIDGGI